MLFRSGQTAAQCGDQERKSDTKQSGNGNALFHLDRILSSEISSQTDDEAIGKALELPFEESFFGSKFTHKGWTTATSQNDPYFTYKAWQLYSSNTVYYLPEDKTLAVATQDNDGGLA